MLKPYTKLISLRKLSKKLQNKMNIRTKISIIVAITFCCFLPVHADTTSSETQTMESEKNNWGGKLIKSPFGLGLDLQTKYVWRGMEMMTEDAAPVLFPSINYSYSGLFIYAMG